MDVTCSQCQGKFKIPDEKLPIEQVVAVACPRCKHKITIDTRTPVDSSSVQALAKLASQSITSETYDLGDKTFDFIEPGAKTAMICESDSTIRSFLSGELSGLGYYAIDASSGAIALKKMRFRGFNLLVLDDLFNAPRTDTDMILDYLGEQLMSARRNIFVILISDQIRTMDHMAALNKNVNLIINKKNIQEFSRIFLQALADYQAFYRIFQESLISAGKG